VVYERPRLLRLSDVVDWSTGQTDDPFTRCSGGDYYAGGLACKGGPSPLQGCLAGGTVSNSCWNGMTATGNPGDCFTGQGLAST
jgi:hypothetical protein